MRRNFSLHKIVFGAVTAGVLTTSVLTAPSSFAQKPVLTGTARPIKTADEKPSTDVEVIRERHPNRTVKIEREVIRDADDNYVSHGVWKMWDQQGRLVANGRYRDGQRQGEWTAWFLENETKLLTQAPFKNFSAPFISKTNFDEGEIDGVWTIHDDRNRKIAEWSFAKGVRHGNWTTWHPNGRKMRQVHFDQGDLHGEATTWSADGKIIGRETFQTGRRLINKTEHFAKNEKKSEGIYLLAKQQLVGQDDWWNAKLASFETVGKDERHGPYKEWYRNGQLRGQGTYENGQPQGQFTWWYENGQRSVEGNFDGGRKVSQWTWWHKNGQKSINGEYETGAPDGNWIWWNAEGKVAQRVEYAAGASPQTPGATEAETSRPEAIAKDSKEVTGNSKRRVAEQPSTTRFR